MEQTALRPKSLPGAAGADPGAGQDPAAQRKPRPHGAHRRGRRLLGRLLGVLCAVVLVLAGVGIGTVGAAVIGLSRMAEMQQRAVPRPPAAPGTPSAKPSWKPSPRPAAARGSLGVEAVDAPRGPGALVVAVHVPGPGYTAGLVRGDVLVSLGDDRIGSASDLAAVVADARPGHELTMEVRHESGARQKLTVVPGVVT
ncbi:PDZ domain-containing protein [Streptomyces sp. VRA16 Mangrove soil]|uniref:PDZ domain-containing protein n=1 Tax=Streptomyces sp. VRA16 Mangrove soil TaxID=2817434 RepID=UPI001A9FC5A9|nr:PDZ domain-containing protein [Streptomyces sp. VRA16 Mangrove soil]MBO1335514.1 PDZ domain-containing protein [Streptomyces sp. VRA16 Mangrove soil]